MSFTTYQMDVGRSGTEVSGPGSIAPASRTAFMVANIGSISVYLTASAGVSALSGYPISQHGYFAMKTDSGDPYTFVAGSGALAGFRKEQFFIKVAGDVSGRIAVLEAS